MEWLNKQSKGDNLYKIPYNWLFLEYFEALNILFRIENALRVFVYIILKSELNEKWIDLSLINDDGKQTTIGSIAKKRLSQDKNYAYLGYILSSPLVHLTSGELIRVITSDSYWQYFKPHFQGAKEIIKTKLDEIGNVRNSLAHFRPIRKEDIELVKSNSIHILSSIEKLIVQYINCPDIVPSNTEDQWYKDLSTLETNHCRFSFSQSMDGQWIKIRLTVSFIAFTILGEAEYQTVYVPNIKSDKVLLLYPILTNSIISSTEVNPITFDSGNKNMFKKTLSFAFKITKLESDFNVLKTQFSNLVQQIEEEIELIKNDGLARGKIIELVKPSFIREVNSNYYRMRHNPFITELRENTPVEFWGEITWTDDDFISSTHIYPWMQTKISEEGLPF